MSTTAFDPLAEVDEHGVMSPVRYDAFLLASFGGPEGQEDVIPFLRNVTKGRGIPDERLEEVATHYRANGGISPINEQNRRLKAALEKELEARGIDVPIYWGNRNWDPYIPEVFEEMYDAGHRRILALSTSAFSGYSSCRQYREDYGMALEKTGLEGKLQVDKIRPYFDHPGFAHPFVEGIEEGIDRVSDALREKKNLQRPRVHVLFCTHSIPTSDALAAGPRLPEGEEYEGGNIYTAQHLALARQILERIPGSEAVSHSLVYQSRSGAPHIPWLEPDVNDALEELAGEVDGVVMVPLGFLSDHMEVKWDLDTEAMETCQNLGIEAVRVPTPGTHDAFVKGAVDLLLERHGSGDKPERPALTDLGPAADVCAPNCCVKIMRDGTQRPTVCAMDSALPSSQGRQDKSALQGTR